ncbi:MAG TPA: diaminopimelate epimerase [Verrucomicrobiae bacterium]|jgi:diaminopimelate epimerase|nr:diaminopimelate epimerase [Verrucomicrobiae bacterium]
MSKELPFFKLEASGNDFVVVDNRRAALKDPVKFTRQVCAPHTGVGADGVLLLEKSRKQAFKMRIINSDGSEAEACGNGFRCISLFAHKKLGLPAKFEFESLSGVIQANVKGSRIRVRMAKPKDYRAEGELSVAGNRLHYSFINTGVPHTVIFVNNLRGIDVALLGRAIRYHEDFKPKGTNVNFVEIKDKHSIHVRTYERGVEQETLACGSGSTASAIISALHGRTQAPVKVKTSGGEILTIDFKVRGKEVTEAYLEGGARFVFEGKLCPFPEVKNNHA